VRARSTPRPIDARRAEPPSRTGSVELASCTMSNRAR
jgi:hypothetical protein